MSKKTTTKQKQVLKKIETLCDFVETIDEPGSFWTTGCLHNLEAAAAAVTSPWVMRPASALKA